MFQNYALGMSAVNPADGTVAWEYKGVPFDTVRTPTATVGPSRGIAYNAKHDLVYMGQKDGSIVALKAKTGAPVWTAQTSGVGTYGSATLAFRSRSRCTTTMVRTGSSSRRRTAARARSAGTWTRTTRRRVR